MEKTKERKSRRQEENTRFNDNQNPWRFTNTKVSSKEQSKRQRKFVWHTCTQNRRAIERSERRSGEFHWNIKTQHKRAAINIAFSYSEQRSLDFLVYMWINTVFQVWLYIICEQECRFFIYFGISNRCEWDYLMRNHRFIMYLKCKSCTKQKQRWVWNYSALVTECNTFYLKSLCC